MANLLQIVELSLEDMHHPAVPAASWPQTQTSALLCCCHKLSAAILPDMCVLIWTVREISPTQLVPLLHFSCCFVLMP